MKPYAEKNSNFKLYTNLSTNLIIKMLSEILKYPHFRRHFAIFLKSYPKNYPHYFFKPASIRNINLLYNFIIQT